MAIPMCSRVGCAASAKWMPLLTINPPPDDDIAPMTTMLQLTVCDVHRQMCDLDDFMCDNLWDVLEKAFVAARRSVPSRTMTRLWWLLLEEQPQ